MGCTVRELQQRMDSREFSEWLAFNQLDPIGAWRADLNSATVCAVIGAAHGGKGRIADYMPEFDPKERPEGPPEDVAAKLMTYFQAHANGDAIIR